MTDATVGSWDHPSVYTARKRWDDLSCVHRNWRGTDRLRVLHGYARSVEIEFTANALDASGVVIDFSAMKSIQQVLEQQFDHTLLVARDDPLCNKLMELEQDGAANVKVMPDTSLEGSAKWVADTVSVILKRETADRVRIARVEMRESPKNAVYLRLN
ncbi:6-carboxytetrahydropterin synthase [Mycobacterium sp. SP-6446]|uniref:6-pyruvoyl trahydropterin synthase family protein n=1 Tax=Mycobacterium sp. SP-6446 TaxID=1834162 RepID=UPI0009FAB89E|nr:6-carboxytetrahydropterin synthase [Mycobacterium sp. SP-6446]